MGGDRAPRPLSKLSLSTFRKPSPSPTSAPVGTVAPSTVVQDGSFMDVLSLKLSEVVSRALAQPTGPAAPGELLAGRRPIPGGRGRALGALIISYVTSITALYVYSLTRWNNREVDASRENPHVYRAVVRTLQRPLSVLLTNRSSNLVSLISSPAFSTPAAPIPQNPDLNATQLHAVSFATFASELLESFDETGLGVEVDTRGESLRNIQEGLLSIVKRVVDPLIAGIKQELLPTLDALENAPSSPAGPTGAAAKASGGIKSPGPNPSIMTL